MKRLFTLGVCVFVVALTLGIAPGKVKPTDKDVLFFVEEYNNTFYPKKEIKQLIFVSVKNQKLYLIRFGKVVSKYDISTSKYGVGSRKHSLRTPLGLHLIAEKVGKGVPIRGIIKGGVYTGKKVPVILGDKKYPADAVTTRYLHLKGLEPGKNSGGNVDTYERRIYIHGTPDEGYIGKPSSHGCVRMKNFDVWELYDLAEKGLYVLILNV